MLRLLILAAVFAAGLSNAALGQTVQVVPSCGAGDVASRLGNGGQLVRDQAGNLCTAAGAAGASAAPSGGIITYRVNSAASTNAASVKASAGRLYAYTLCNVFSAARYVRLFNLGTAPVPGTSVPTIGPILIAAGACQQFSSGIGLTFSNGIGMTITGANGDTDNTAIGAGDVTGFLGYQ